MLLRYITMLKKSDIVCEIQFSRYLICFFPNNTILSSPLLAHSLYKLTSTNP